MKEQLITCPHCKKKFPLSEAMQHEIEAKVKSDYQDQINALEEEHVKEIEKAKADAAKQAVAKAKNDSKLELENLKNQVKELETKEEEFNEKELKFLKREREIAQEKKNLALEKQEFVNKKTEELQ